MTTRKYSSRSQQTTLTGAVTSGATSMTVVSGTALLGGVTIPAGTTFTLVLDPDTAIEEIVDATAVSTNTFTITRAIDGSSAQDHSAGGAVRHMAIGRDYRDANLHAEASAYYNDGSGSGHTMHGIGSGEGDVVGTAKSQTLTNKTLTSPAINTPTITGATIAGAVTASATVTLTGSIVVSGGTITGLSSAGMVASSATPKDYVDAILGSATAAATSAASAAASATAAATSASSAATSATSSATSASAAATSATNAAASATAAATSATSAAASATAAATSATSASNSATAAATSATSAAASATTAAASVAAIAAYAAAAATSAASASTSASSALTSANSAATSAASAAASTSAAAASATAAATSATSAAASATAAATSATSASASATAAATSASSASTSASSALTSANSAATSASSAAASYELFDDRFLGAKATPPTTDNDGNPLTDGVIYYNSTDYNMYVWNGGTSSWQVFTSTGDITAVNAGTGLSGGGTSGAVTLSLDSAAVISPAIFAAKGDILVATANDTPAVLTVASTNGYVLSVNSATATGLQWVVNAADGVQSVTSGNTTRISIGGTSTDPTVDLVTTAVSAGTYTSATITVDAYGRLTSASTGASGGAQLSDVFMLMGA